MDLTHVPLGLINNSEILKLLLWHLLVCKLGTVLYQRIFTKFVDIDDLPL